MSEIYRMVLEANHRDVRIAFVAASRRDDEWRRVTRQPRLTLLPLSEFKRGVVTDALRRPGWPDGPAVQRRRAAGMHAERVYRVSEGCPRCSRCACSGYSGSSGSNVHRLSEREGV